MVARDRLQIRLTSRPGRAELRLSGEATLQTVGELLDRLIEAEASAPAVLVIDLRDVRFMDSTALRELVTARNRLRRDGRRLVLVMAAGPVERLLALAWLQGRFETVAEPP